MRSFSELTQQNLKDSESHADPSDVARILNQIPLESAIEVFKGFDDKKQLLVFPFVDDYLKRKLYKKSSDNLKSFLINNLGSVDRLYFLNSLKGVDRSSALTFLNEPVKSETERLMGYPSDSVVRLVNTQFVILKEDMTVEEAIQFLQDRQSDSEAANVLYVVNDEGKLMDDMPIRKLVLNSSHKRLKEVMDYRYISLAIEDTAEDAVLKFQQYDKVVLPVTNADDQLMGIVTIDDVMDVSERENTREMQRFGGQESLEYPYVKTPFFSLIQKRAGWLVILFISEMLTATVMGYFEVEIEKAVVLALFVPLVISSGGNSGSQAATLIIRAMAVCELTVRDWWYVLKREVLSGLCLGITLGVLGLLRIAVWQELGWYDYGEHWLLIGVTIFLSLIGIVLWGTFSGSMIPIILKRMKIDPATSSAPFVATLVDVTGLVIYFSIAAIVLRDTLL